MKKMGGLMKHFGVLKGDKEYDKVMREARKGWVKWTREYKSLR